MTNHVSQRITADCMENFLFERLKRIFIEEKMFDENFRAI